MSGIVHLTQDINDTYHSALDIPFILDRRSTQRCAHGRTPVPQSAGLPGDSSAADRASQHGFEEGCCRGRKGCVTYDGRESLTFNGVPGNLSLVFVRADIGTLNSLLQAVQTPTAGVLESHFVTRRLRFAIPRLISSQL